MRSFLLPRHKLLVFMQFLIWFEPSAHFRKVEMQVQQLFSNVSVEPLEETNAMANY